MPMIRLAGGGATILLALLIGLLSARPAEALSLCLGSCSCSVSATPVAFGSYDPLSGNVGTATGAIQVTCQLLSGSGISLLETFSVALSSGQSGSVANRKMVLMSGTAMLLYNLYSDAGMTTVWGDSSGGSPVSGSVSLTLVNVGVSTNYTVYGKIPASQLAQVGNYSDMITVTVTF